MAVHRGYLFWGIFFLLLGGIPLLDRLGVIDASAWGDVWRLWPVIIIAIGIAILVGRSQLAAAGTVVAAIAVGGVAGGALAAGGGFIGDLGDCLPDSRAASEGLTEDGDFGSAASVELEMNCGRLGVTTAAGTAWTLTAAYVGDPPQIAATNTSLSVETPDGRSRRHEWDVALPIDSLRDLHVAVNAGESSLDVGGMQLDELDVELNAGDLILIAEGAAIETLDVELNAGRARVTLDGRVAGALSVNAGGIDLCVPDDAALRFEVAEQLTFATNLDDAGLTQSGETWTRSGSGPQIVLEIEGNAANLTLDPEDGCR